jgi:hypothetical protein
MATPINVFKKVTAEVTTLNEIIYTAPAGNTGILLMAQVANITSTAGDVTFIYFDSSTNNDTELVKGFTVPGNDAAALITGKLIVEEGDSVKVFATENDKFKVTLSILESLNA